MNKASCICNEETGAVCAWHDPAVMADMGLKHATPVDELDAQFAQKYQAAIKDRERADRATVRRDIASRLLERMAVFSDIKTHEAVGRSIEWTDALLAALEKGE